jgi:hypothetical protein
VVRAIVKVFVVIVVVWFVQGFGLLGSLQNIRMR